MWVLDTEQFSSVDTVGKGGLTTAFPDRGHPAP